MRSLGALVFPYFETLDSFGSLELFGWLPEEFEMTLVGERAGCVTCRSGQRVVFDCTLDALLTTTI